MQSIRGAVPQQRRDDDGQDHRVRWIIRVTDEFGKPNPITVHVRGGHVYTFRRDAGAACRMDPEDVTKLRAALHAAQAEAIWQRGGTFD